MVPPAARSQIERKAPGEGKATMAPADTTGFHRLHWDPAAERMIALARNAHRSADQRSIDRRDDIDYWYRLGQRNAYAHAGGIVIARGVDSTAFAISERLTAALEDRVVDLGPLRSTALGETTTSGLAQSPTWLGPMAFAAQLGSLPGVDQDYGMRWGPAGEQRISLRHPVADDRGLLYAYDPTWDEYTVLYRDATAAAVRSAFTQAVGTNIHMSVTDFTSLVASHETTPTPARQPGGPEL